MKKIEFVGGIANELAEVIESNNINTTCVEGNVCEISDEDFATLQKVAPAAFDGNDILVLTDMKQFSVYYNTNVECNKVAEFDRLDESKAYCEEQVKGYEYAGVGCPDETHNISFSLDVYDGSPINEDSLTGLNDPVFTTGWYYNE